MRLCGAGLHSASPALTTRMAGKKQASAPCSCCRTLLRSSSVAEASLKVPPLRLMDPPCEHMGKSSQQALPGQGRLSTAARQCSPSGCSACCRRMQVQPDTDTHSGPGLGPPRPTLPAPAAGAHLIAGVAAQDGVDLPALDGHQLLAHAVAGDLRQGQDKAGWADACDRECRGSPSSSKQPARLARRLFP